MSPTGGRPGAKARGNGAGNLATAAGAADAFLIPSVLGCGVVCCTVELTAVKLRPDGTRSFARTAGVRGDDSSPLDPGACPGTTAVVCLSRFTGGIAGCRGLTAGGRTVLADTAVPALICVCCPPDEEGIDKVEGTNPGGNLVCNVLIGGNVDPIGGLAAGILSASDGTVGL